MCSVFQEVMYPLRCSVYFFFQCFFEIGIAQIPSVFIPRLRANVNHDKAVMYLN
jgi:hypothetical protein